MKILTRPLTLPVLMLGALLTLTGCSGEPGAEDMKKAIESSIKSNPVAAAMFGGFESFEKIACKEAQNKPGYVCDYKATVTLMGQKSSRNDSSRFVKGDNGWQAIQD